MPRQTSIQLTEATERQIAALKVQGYGSTTDIIRVAIDRMYQGEIMQESVLAQRAGISATDSAGVVVEKVRNYTELLLSNETPAYRADQSLMLLVGIAATLGLDQGIVAAFLDTYGEGAAAAIQRRNSRLG